MFLDDLSVKDKIEVLKELYKDIAELGVEGDTELAHINTFEANLLRKCGGSGTLNPNTGLPQYSKGGGGTPQATFQNTNQFSRIPDEVAPFASDVLTEAQDYYRMIMNQGYDPYTGAVTAPQTAEQTEAQAGLSALGRGAQGTALQQEALGLQRQQGEKFTPEVAQEYMSPYQRAVTDIEKRKATEDFDRNIMPRFEKQAVDAGGMSGLGSRAGVQAGILGEGLQTRLGEIEAKGLQSSFLNAQQQFQNQKAREAGQATQTAALGPAMFSQGLAQQGALQTVGEQKQTLGQKGLDEQYFKFLEQKAFPEEQLAKYSGFVYGNPLLAQRDVTSTAQAGRNFNQPSSGAQLLGAGLAGANAFRQIAPQNFNSFASAINPFKGGGGLSDIIYRQENGQTSPDDNESFIERSLRRDREFGNKALKFIRNIPEKLDRNLGTSAVKVLGPIYDVAGDVVTGVTGIDTPTAENVTGVKPFNFSRDILGEQDDVPVNNISMSNMQGTEGGPFLQPSLSSEELATLAEGTSEVGSGGVGLEGILGPKEDRQGVLTQDQIDARMRPDMYDPNVVRRRADERERSREGFYSKSDKERRSFNKSMADRRRSERDADYQRRRGLIGEADPMGTLLSQLSQSLLRTREDDGGFLSRVGEGLNRTTSKISEADKARNEKLLKVEDEFGKRRAEESEKEFEAEGQMLSRGEEREALALAREFKLEDKILGLPYAKQKQAIEIMLSNMSIKEKQARINLLNAQAAAEGRTELSPTETNAVIKMFDNNNAAIFGQGFVDGKPFPVIEEDLNKARQASLKIANSQGLEAANKDYMERARRIKDAYAAGKYAGNTPGKK